MIYHAKSWRSSFGDGQIGGVDQRGNHCTLIIIRRGIHGNNAIGKGYHRRIAKHAHAIRGKG